MKRKGKSEIDQLYLKSLASRISALIREKGYCSPYEFWINESDDMFSRTSLHYILTGRADPKITTLRVIAEALGVSISELLNFTAEVPPYRPPEETEKN